MKENPLEHLGKSALAMAVVALVIRLLVVLVIRQDAAVVLGPLSDAGDYDHLAQSILAGNGLAAPTGEPTAFRPPAYPAFLAAVYAVFGMSNLLAVGLVQAFVGALHVFLLMFTARMVGLSMRVTLFAGAVASLYPAFLFQTPQILGEVLHRFLQMAALLGIVLALRVHDWKFAIIGGTFFAAAILSKPVLLAAVPFVLLLIFLWETKATDLLSGVTLSLAFLVPVVFGVGAWSARNRAISGEFIAVSTNFPITFAQGVTRHSYYTKKWNGDDDLMEVPGDFLELTQLRSYHGVLDERTTGGHFASQARAFIADRPGWFASLTLRKALHFWNPLIRNEPAVQAVALISMGPILVGGWIWIFLALWKRREAWLLAWLALAVALPATIPHALSQPDVRYRLAIADPLWVMMAAALAGLIPWRRQAKPSGES